MPEKYYVAWGDVCNFIDYVAEECTKISEETEYPITGVFGLPRGGLSLAVMLSHKMDIPMLMSPCTGCIIIDDICDSGESLLHYVKDTSGIDPREKAYIVATMFYKENKLGIKPDIYMQEKGNKWIVFPWEREEY